MNTKGYMNAQDKQKESRSGLDVKETIIESDKAAAAEISAEDFDDNMSDIDAMLRELNLDTRNGRRMPEQGDIGGAQEETDAAQEPEEFEELSIEDMLEDVGIGERPQAAGAKQGQTSEREDFADAVPAENPKEQKRREKQARKQAKSEAKKAAKEAKKAAKKTAQEGAPEEEKAQGGLKGLFNKLTEDVDEEPEPQKGRGKTDASADASIEEFDGEPARDPAEDAKKAAAQKKKAKADQKAKAKKEKEKKAAEKSKAKAKAKAAKAKTAKKETKPKAEEKPGKRLKKSSILIIAVFAASILGMILLVNMFLSPILEKRGAQEAFREKDYVACYRLMAGMNLSEEEAKVQQHAEVVLKMTRRLENYEYYREMFSELEALNSLMTGVASYDTLYAQAAACGAVGEVQDIYNRILGILTERYGISEAEARQIISCESDVEYTRYLTALITGESIGNLPGQSSPETIVSPETGTDDLLPEEQEMPDGNFSD